jgi:GT2 family glycosyltransferase
MKLDNLTAVTVCCNTPQLLKDSVFSIRKFYPELRIIIINGSTVGHECDHYCKDLNNPFIEVANVGYNIGHGPGMNLGITMADTDFVLLFDTDITLKGMPLQRMMELFEEDTFGVGEVIYDDQLIGPYNIKFGKGEEKFSVLHPYFHIIQKKVYRKFLPYVQSGGPCFLTALDIFSQGLSDKILKPFPVRDYVDHTWRGTRDVEPPDMFKNKITMNEELFSYLKGNWINIRKGR